MRDWLEEGIDDLIAEYKKDIELISGKNKDIEIEERSLQAYFPCPFPEDS